MPRAERRDSGHDLPPRDHDSLTIVVRLKGERRTDLVVSRDRVRALKERLGLV